MAYDPGALHAALAAAVGDDPTLVAELRGAFIASAASLTDLLARSRCDANWRAAAWRLHGLSASFGALDLMELAAEAATGAPGDPLVLRRIDAAVHAFQGSA
jgi:HPt (histidine-containing phosphotransfer) domain-containing protein